MNSKIAWLRLEKILLCPVGRATADFETRLVSRAFNKWEGIGGYVEVLSKDLPYLLDSFLYAGPFLMRLSRLSNQATPFGQRAQGLPSPVWIPGSAVFKAKLSVVPCFKLCAVANLNPFVTQE